MPLNVSIIRKSGVLKFCGKNKDDLLTILYAQQNIPEVLPGHVFTQRVLCGDVDDGPTFQELEDEVQLVFSRVVQDLVITQMNKGMCNDFYTKRLCPDCNLIL